MADHVEVEALAPGGLALASDNAADRAA